MFTATLSLGGSLGVAGSVFVLITGLASVAAVLVGFTKKGIYDTMRATIEALKERVDTLESDVKACSERDKQKDAALKVLTDQLRGADQLVQIATQISEAVKASAAMHAEVLQAARANHLEIMAQLNRIEYVRETRR